jgi:hypothetical protein
MRITPAYAKALAGRSFEDGGKKFEVKGQKGGAE